MPTYKRLHPAITLGVAATWTLLLALAFIIAVLLGWPGDPDPQVVNDSSQLYGERLQMDKAIKQPWSTWSDLGFVFGGWGMLVVACFCGEKNPPNPMATSSVPSLFYGLVFIYLGPGSMFFHAGGTKWGGVLDGLSMGMFMSFACFYDLWRVAGMPSFAAIFTWIAGALVSVVVLWFYDPFGKIALALWMLVTFILQALIQPAILDLKILGVEIRMGNLLRGRELGGGKIQREPLWLALALGTFGVAMVPWLLTQKGHSHYDLDRVPPGHFWWHLLGAIAVFFLYLYYRSEKTR